MFNGSFPGPWIRELPLYCAGEMLINASRGMLGGFSP